MQLGRTIVSIRTRKGMKASKLAEKVGVTASYLSLIENERRTITMRMIKAIGVALDVSSSSILLEAMNLTPRPEFSMMLEQVVDRFS